MGNGPLIAFTWMVYPSHTALPELDSTSGHLLLVSRKPLMSTFTLVRVPTVWPGDTFLPMLVTTISVRVVTQVWDMSTLSTQLIHSGMVRDVEPPPAVSWATHQGWPLPGSVSSYPRPQLTTLKFACVQMKEPQTRTFHLSLSSSTYITNHECQALLCRLFFLLVHVNTWPLDCMIPHLHYTYCI